MKFDLKSFKVIDWTLYILPVIFACLGVSIIYSMTYYTESKIYIDQIIFILVGLAVMIFLTFTDYRQLRSSSRILYIIGTVLLIAVLFFGKSVYGSSRWINLIIFDLQPSELVKLFLLISLSSFLAPRIGRINFKVFFSVFMITLIPVVLTLMQPDLGTTIIYIVCAITLLFFSKLNIKQIIIFISIILLALPVGWMVLKDYQKERVMTFINPQSDPYGAGYNVSQSLITVGSGGIWGKGFGRGPQSQLNFLPVAHTDFVFAGIAESIGFVGSSLLLVLILFFVLKCVKIATISKDNFGSLLAIGIGTLIFFQSLVNIGMNIGLLPVTGIPLPFISYGGSSTVSMLASVGILQSISIRNRKISFK